MQSQTLTVTETKKLLAQAEDYYVEFKSIDIKPAGVEKMVSAFGNSSGGDIYVGISEPNRGAYRWSGFERVEDANSLLFVLQNAFPPSDSFEYVMLDSVDSNASGYVLRIAVMKTREICKTSAGKVYRRAGAQAQAVDTDEGLEILALQKGVTSYEKQTLGAPIDMITDSYQVTEFALEALTFSEPEPWLRNQLMIVEGRPTVAGVVLFADEPQVVLPKASVMVYRYASRDTVGQRDDLVDGKTWVIEGSAMAQIRGTVAKTTELIQTVRDSDLKPAEYPPETLHEIITNAVIHRDYSTKDNVHVRIFDDRVEVQSPGLLPGHVTPHNLPGARFSRNETIERILHKFPEAPNKNVGEGMITAFEAMGKMRLAAPVVSEVGGSVLVTIRHAPLDSPATQILKYLETHETITNREARSLTNTPSESTMRRALKKMVSQGAIEQVPGTVKGGYKYRRTSAEIREIPSSTESATIR